MLGIVDCGTSNLRSVENVFAFLGTEFAVTSNAEELDRFDRLVLPGVGTFARAMQNLHEKQLPAAIQAYAATGKPILGICLGMQLLADRGTEPEPTEGLGLIPGQVIRFQDQSLRLPHVGWNTLIRNQVHPVLQGIKEDVDFYFVHSYHYQPAAVTDLVASCEYGSPFPCVVARNNVIGVQFHPEKSQKHGLRLLENFLALC